MLMRHIEFTANVVIEWGISRGRMRRCVKLRCRLTGCKPLPAARASATAALQTTDHFGERALVSIMSRADRGHFPYVFDLGDRGVVISIRDRSDIACRDEMLLQLGGRGDGVAEESCELAVGGVLLLTMFAGASSPPQVDLVSQGRVLRPTDCRSPATRWTEHQCVRLPPNPGLLEISHPGTMGHAFSSPASFRFGQERFPQSATPNGPSA